MLGFSLPEQLLNLPFVIVVEVVQGNNVRGTSINICMTSVSETLNMLSGKVFSLSLSLSLNLVLLLVTIADIQLMFVAE